MGKLGLSNTVCIVVVFCAATAIISPAQMLTTLAAFAGSNGADPKSTLIQGIDGNIYGTTSQGGANNLGTVFKVSTGGTLTTLHDFAGHPADGADPQAGLVQASDGNFYGTTSQGGANNLGTVFKITPTGTLTMLHSFNTTDGASPISVLLQSTDGNFYGTTQSGGNGGGTVFKITPAGMLTTLHSFTGGSDGYAPEDGLVQGSDGNFYGTTNQGGAHSGGTVFKVTPSGTLTTLYNFCSQMGCTDGEDPFGVLVQAIDGNFYGTTGEGGIGVGTVFKITPTGMLTTLHSFTGGSDGYAPEDGMVQATDGNLYGTTNLGGAHSGGTVFKITLSGTLTTVYNFCSQSGCTDGRSSYAGLVQAADGNFYGTTNAGGANGDGTAFKLSVGIVLSPVQFIPVTPCRLVDTRNPVGEFGGPPLQGGTPRFFVIPDNRDCNIPATAAAYSLNVTVVPHEPLGYLTIWPTGKNQPVVSTLNSVDGRVKANAAIVPVGVSAAVSVFASNTTDLILDIDGYFAPASSSTYQFYPLTPCRIVDTRGGQDGGMLHAGVERDYSIAGTCDVPSSATAYSFNVTVLPAAGGLDYLTVWPKGETQPVVSTLNDNTGTVVANAAIVPAGSESATAFYAHSNSTNLLVDIDGYFAAPGTGGYSFYPVAPCRVLDTRQSGGSFTGEKTVNVVGSACAPPSSAAAYIFNATVVPPGPMLFLSLWPDGELQPTVSTLNAEDGFITSNMAIVPTNNGSIDAYAYALTQLILDISGYFAP
ncbi:MAG: choice-of-anchor tandem repeat GloVer-containing protein [Candidatus Korobacteraceae bacterium]